MRVLGYDVNSTLIEKNFGTLSNSLSGNVTMVSANTFYNGGSLTLGVGTWLLVGVATVQSVNASAMRVTVKLWNGTTVASSSEQTCPSMGTSIKGLVSISLVGVVTIPSGTETWRMSATATIANYILLGATQDNGAGNNANTLMAFQISDG